MKRRLLAATILGLWLGALGFLVHREYLGGGAPRLADQPLNVSPTATYYRVELGGRVVGFASNLVDTLADSVRVQDLLVLEVPARGAVERVEARTEAVLTRALKLRSFTASLRGSQSRFEVVGTVLGDTLLRLAMTSAQSTQTTSVRLRRPILLPNLVPLRVAFGGDVEIGRTYTLPLFDPLLLEDRDMAVTITAESTMVVVDSAGVGADSLWVPARWDTVRAWRVAQSVGGVPLEAWVDPLGRVVSASTPMGFRMERTAFEIAYHNFRLRSGSARLAAWGEDADVIRQTAIAARGPGATALGPEGVGELRVRLRGVDLRGFSLSGGRQTLIGDTLVIRRENPEELDASYRLPAMGPEVRAFLADEPLLNVGDPRIRAQARVIVGRTRDPERVARLLTDWVYEQIEKRVTVSVPSALEVLETRRGDCNEHTVLYVALARAVGLPARTAAGLVYLDGRFYYHAWPEVWLGREWVAVDPTFGQFPADAAHLRFTIGGLARQLELIRLIGRLDIDILEARPTT